MSLSFFRSLTGEVFRIRCDDGFGPRIDYTYTPDGALYRAALSAAGFPSMSSARQASPRENGFFPMTRVSRVTTVTPLRRSLSRAQTS